MDKLWSKRSKESSTQERAHLQGLKGEPAWGIQGSQGKTTRLCGDERGGGHGTAGHERPG